MIPLYVIVHEGYIWSEKKHHENMIKALLEEGPFSQETYMKVLEKKKDYERSISYCRSVLSEIEKIKKIEDFSVIEDSLDPTVVDLDLDTSRPILVCGAFEELCVQVQKESIEDRLNHKNVQIYRPATLALRDISESSPYIHGTIRL